PSPLCVRRSRKRATHARYRTVRARPRRVDLEEARSAQVARRRRGRLDMAAAAARGTSARGLRPAWSPDGDRIAFQRHGDIYVMRADGSHVVRLTHQGGFTPAW